MFAQIKNLQIYAGRIEHAAAEAILGSNQVVSCKWKSGPEKQECTHLKGYTQICYALNNL